MYIYISRVFVFVNQLHLNILRLLIFVNRFFLKKWLMYLFSQSWKSVDLFFDRICETPCIPCGGMVLIQETNIKLNLFKFSVLSTDNFIITKVVLSMVISIIQIRKTFMEDAFKKNLYFCQIREMVKLRIWKFPYPWNT